MVNQNLTCSQCSEKALYKDELKNYCKNCYWELEKNKCRKPKGDLFTDSDVYRNCPYCGLGDLCDTSGCVKQCMWCKFIDEKKPYDKAYCSLECEKFAEKEEKRKSELEISKWCSFCSQPAGNVRKNDYPNKYFCRDCFLKKNPEIKMPDKKTLRKRKRNLRSNWACPHYEAEFNDQLIADVRETEKERIIKSYWLPEWKPVMKNKEGKNVCADCYHDSAEYLSLVQVLTAEKFADECQQVSSSRNDYEKIKSGSLSSIEEFEEVKEKIRKEIVDKNQESRIKNQESRIKNQESRIKNQESRINFKLSNLTPSNQ